MRYIVHNMGNAVIIKVRVFAGLTGPDGTIIHRPASVLTQKALPGQIRHETGID
jgi:hypothetical protein